MSERTEQRCCERLAKNMHHLLHEYELLQVEHSILRKTIEDDKEKLKQATARCEILDFELEELKINYDSLNEELDDQRNQCEMIMGKYVSHRQVFQKNEENAAAEINKLNDLITDIFQRLKNLPEDIKENDNIKELLEAYNKQPDPENNQVANQ